MKDVYAKLLEDLEYSNKLQSLEMYSGYSYDQQVLHCIDDNFNATIKDYSETSIDSLKHLGLQGDILRYRKKILINTIDEINNKFKTIYPNLSIPFEYISYFSSPSFSNYDEINDRNYILEAAAIFILYELDNHDRLDEVIKLLPKFDGMDTYAIVHPEAKDLLFSKNLICSLVSVIQGFFGYDEKDDYQYILTKKYTNKNPDELKYFDILNTIFSLIDKDVLENAVLRFHQDYDKVLNFIFKYSEFYQNIINKNYQKQLSLLKKIRNYEINESVIFKSQDKNAGIEQFKFANEINELTDQNEDIINAKHLLRLSLNFIYDDNTILNEEMEDFVKDEAYSLEIDDPFETSFAFLYLLFTKDNIIWNTNACMTILKLGAEKLPWTKDINFARNDNEEEQKIIKHKYDLFLKQTKEEIDKDNKESNNYDHICATDLYKQKYNDSWRWENIDNAKDGDILKWNLPQLIFDYSSYILPKSLFVFNRDNNYKFVNSGFKPEQIELLQMLMATYGSVGIQDEDVFDEDLQQEEQPDENIQNIENLKELLSKRNEEISKLKSSYSEIRKKYSNLKYDYDNLKIEFNNLNNELSQLRELIFNLQSNTFNQEFDDKINIKLPYVPKKKILIIGGSDTWINKFNEVLSNTEFISSKVRINQDLLKTASTFWIQTISLKHSDFYTISNYASKHHVPVHYFSYSNINKCLEQIIAVERMSK